MHARGWPDWDAWECQKGEGTYGWTGDNSGTLEAPAEKTWDQDTGVWGPTDTGTWTDP